MRMTPIMILIEKKKNGDGISIAELNVALSMERKMIIDAFNACALEEVLNNKKYLNGEDYYEQNYSDLDSF